MTNRRPKAAETCGNCRHVHVLPDKTHICYRNPPAPVVIDNKPQNMRCSVQPNERACGEYKSITRS